MSTIINVKVERKLKLQAQKTAQELGLPLSALIKAYLRDLVVEKRVIISEPPTPNRATARILDEALRDIAEGKNIFSSLDD